MNDPISRTLETLPAALGLVLALGSSGLAGCFEVSDEQPAKMTIADYDEVAAALSALVLDETNGQPNAFGSATQLAQGVVPVEFHVNGDVAMAELRGREYSLSAVCSDALGRGALCGVDATMAHVAAAWTGDSSDFDADWTLVDLDQDVLVLAGGAQATASVAGEVDGEVDGWRLDYRASFDDVGIDAKTRRAVSGQVFYDLTVERRADIGSEYVSVDGRLTFQADGTSTLTLDGHVYSALRDGSIVRQ